MGSAGDWPSPRGFGAGCDVRVLSAHRTPDPTVSFARTAEERGLQAAPAAADVTLWAEVAAAQAD